MIAPCPITTVYEHRDDLGMLSPARCDIVSVENPHVSTYLKVMHQVRVIKENVRAACDRGVDELALVVSIFDEQRPFLALASHDASLPSVFS